MNLRACLLVLFVSGSAFAEDLLPPVPAVKLEPIPPGDDIIRSIKKGQTAPFDGQLFSPETALRWSNYLDQYDVQLKLVTKTTRELCQLELHYKAEAERVEREAHAQNVRELLERVDRLERQNLALQKKAQEKPPWYKTRTFGVVLGATGSAALFGASVWALGTIAR
jgi:hypothetical protein